ncbi:MAG: redox-regulated ATPase YchF [Planctomycetes bacterium]|nr:redox-regulated ATPase YchF [Planctomycetota bacterium]
MKIAIVGTQGSGKSSLFCGLSGAEYAPGSTMKFNTATVNIADPRLDKLHQAMCPDKKIVYPQMDFTDSVPLYLESNLKDKNPAALGHLREHDCIIIMVPAFSFEKLSAESVKRYYGDIRTELLLADLQIIENRSERLRVQIERHAPTHVQDKKELELLTLLRAELENTGRISVDKLGAEQEKTARCFCFFALKPIVAVINIGEAVFTPDNSMDFPFFIINASLELEIMSMPSQEQKDFLQAYGIEKPRFKEFSKWCYDKFGMITFFTVGPKEAHAWRLKNGSTALDAGGTIHSDIAKGFISMEVIKYADWDALGSMKEVKNKGRTRTEGRTYIMQDGDMIDIRFNV